MHYIKQKGLHLNLQKDMEYIKLKYASRKLLRHMIVVHGVTEDIESIPMNYDDVVVVAA